MGAPAESGVGLATPDCLIDTVCLNENHLYLHSDINCFVKRLQGQIHMFVCMSFNLKCTVLGRCSISVLDIWRWVNILCSVFCKQ